MIRQHSGEVFQGAQRTHRKIIVEDLFISACSGRTEGGVPINWCTEPHRPPSVAWTRLAAGRVRPGRTTAKKLRRQLESVPRVQASHPAEAAADPKLPCPSQHGLDNSLPFSGVVRAPTWCHYAGAFRHSGIFSQTLGYVDHSRLFEQELGSGSATQYCVKLRFGPASRSPSNNQHLGGTKSN